MSIYADQVSALLARADEREFSPGQLQVADLLARAMLYPTEDVSRADAPGMSVVRSWPTRYTAGLKVIFRAATKDMALDELPEYVHNFAHERFVNPCFVPFLDAIEVLLLRYAVIEHHNSGMYIAPVDQHDHEHGYALHTTRARAEGEYLPIVSAQIPWEPSSGQRWRGWAGGDLPRFLLGPLRFAPFTCCPPRACCRPNSSIVYQRVDRPFAACLTVLRDIAPGERIVVEWSDVFLLSSSSPLACSIEP
ncbi:hypothetical protein EXIGLDRAFT_771165 [Exidia glandulosa HHB12029]|uniref:SET domain-containing protein n=1 Tax=Exidia glandulosa HHB12029 TaxID=1314781 RepID=A0A165G646_EXIGL|nr:hypothetical protein EXIGLDRAFT_771165 [Exidia glandulosa HHB12029]